MKYIAIYDYPYYTVKKFFPELENITEYITETKNLLNARYYQLSSYKETEHGVNYGVDLSTRVDMIEPVIIYLGKYAVE